MKLSQPSVSLTKGNQSITIRDGDLAINSQTSLSITSLVINIKDSSSTTESLHQSQRYLAINDSVNSPSITRSHLHQPRNLVINENLPRYHTKPNSYLNKKNDNELIPRVESKIFSRFLTFSYENTHF